MPKLFGETPPSVPSNFNFLKSINPSKKLTPVLLAFLFTFTPLAPAFADSADPASPPPAAVSTDTQPTSPPSVSDKSLSPAPTDSAATLSGSSANPAPATDQSTTAIPPPDTTKKTPPSTPFSSITPSTPSLNEAFNPVKQQFPQVNKNSGALTYAYNLAVPPGRNNMQPDLKLSYNSNDKTEGSIFGYGWSLVFHIFNV